jgi:mannose-6-phosphate isomerase-like protein (cupin superfamily)
MKRRDIFPLAAALPLFAADPALSDALVNADQSKLTHEPFGDLRVYFSGPTGQLRSMTAGSLLLKPGMEPHPPHQHPEEEFIVVTEGHGEILIDGKTHKVGPGSMMYSGANRLHGIKNTGQAPLLFYYYKWLK